MRLLLKCPACNSDLNLTVAYSGTDWNSEAGKDSGYGYPIHLGCTNDGCSNVYTLGYLNDSYCFSPAESKPYVSASGFIASRTKGR